MQPGYTCLDEVEQRLFRKIGIQDRAIAHLCCNNGIELLSLKNMGAGECVGFDIADLAIQEAAERAMKCQIDCQFVRSDVYEIGPEFNDRYDIVFISIGGLGWLPDLKLFFAKVESLLRANGQVLIHEQHPFSEMLPLDSSGENDMLRIVEPYFKSEPYVEYAGLDYVGQTKYASNKPQYWFVHKLSDIFSALLENKLHIEHFSEYENDISTVHKRIEEAHAGIPLSYALIGRKLQTGI